MIATQSEVYFNNIPAARLHDPVTPHGRRRHRNPRIVEASPNVFIQGIPVARMEDAASCDHRISSASQNVNVN